MPLARRAFLKRAAAAGLLAGPLARIVSAGREPAPAKPADGPAQDAPPNLLFILADDLGYGDVGCYGCPDIRTPHLDRLAADGVRFTDAYAGGAVCSPTRAAFVTGLYPPRTGLENAIYYQQKGTGLPVGEPTLATRLRKAGYATGLVGKWHLGYDDGRRPMQQGFDHFFGLLGGNHHYFTHVDRIGVHDLWRGDKPVTQPGYTTDLLTEDAVAFLRRHREEPFFLFLSHAAPHFPWQGPDDADRLVEPKHKSWQTGDRETYVAMVERMDHGIGRVLDELQRLGLARRTLVVFTSDNGGHTHSRNAPLRDGKATLWEGGIRVPCIARWPGVIPPGRVSRQVTITMDWTATFLALAGRRGAPADLDGIDLTAALKDPEKRTPRTLFWRRVKGPHRLNVREQRAVRDGRWKLLVEPDGSTMVFDLEEDPAESRDRAGERPDLVRRLRDRLDRWNQRMPAPEPVKPKGSA